MYLYCCRCSFISNNNLTIGKFSFQVFAILVFEMVLFLGLIIPLPYKIRQNLFDFISENPIVAKFQYGLKVRGLETPPCTLCCVANFIPCLDYVHIYFDSLY